MPSQPRSGPGIRRSCSSMSPRMSSFYNHHQGNEEQSLRHIAILIEPIEGGRTGKRKATYRPVPQRGCGGVASAGQKRAKPMTESEWWVCQEPQEMLAFLRDRGKASHRKMRLFGLACCLQVWHPLPD